MDYKNYRESVYSDSDQWAAIIEYRRWLIQNALVDRKYLSAYRVATYTAMAESLRRKVR